MTKVEYQFDYQNYYMSLQVEESERDLLCLLLDKNLTQFNLGIKEFSKMASGNIGERELSRYLKELLPLLLSSNAFIMEGNTYLSPNEALEMIDCLLLLENLYEDFLRKSGRRSFFIANFKAVKPEWCFIAFEFLLAKEQGIAPGDLLGLSIGLKQDDLGIISKWARPEIVKVFISLTRKKPIGYFQDGSFIGFKSYKKINSVEDLLQLMFEEIDLLTAYFQKREGVYFELYGNIAGIRELPPQKNPTPPKSSIAKIKSELTPLQKSLIILNLKEMPVSQKELKKIFFRLAAATHPDKFEHVDKGTRTELAIVDKFREVYSAYEILEKELEKIK